MVAVKRELRDDVPMTQYNHRHHHHHQQQQQHHQLNVEHPGRDCYTLPPVDSFLLNQSAAWPSSSSFVWHSPGHPDRFRPWVTSTAH